ncbi:unnamed protein product [Linum trigynum]|uniref:Uncharacterized protein n=1 Tax=Linum trigynum TaxID=586398 RepID=A0AAV2E6L8_9ROSI
MRIGLRNLDLERTIVDPFLGGHRKRILAVLDLLLSIDAFGSVAAPPNADPKEDIIYIYASYVSSKYLADIHRPPLRSHNH